MRNPGFIHPILYWEPLENWIGLTLCCLAPDTWWIWGTKLNLVTQKLNNLGLRAWLSMQLLLDMKTRPLKLIINYIYVYINHALHPPQWAWPWHKYEGFHSWWASTLLSLAIQHFTISLVSNLSWTQACHLNSCTGLGPDGCTGSGPDMPCLKQDSDPLTTIPLCTSEAEEIPSL